MSTPNPFTFDEEHWALINAFVRFKAEEDGVSDVREQIDLMRQYWLLLADKSALQAEVEAIEIERLEATVATTKQAVVDQEKELADRKAGNPPPRTRPAPEPVEEQPVTAEELRQRDELSRREAAELEARDARTTTDPDAEVITPPT